MAWADDRTIAATGIDGRLLTSTDAGANWTSSQEPIGEVTALGASRTDDGDVEALLMAKNQVLRTVDGAVWTGTPSFTPLWEQLTKRARPGSPAFSPMASRPLA